MPVIIIAIAAALLLVNLCLELKRDLMMFQQNSYRIERYRRWLSESGDSTSIWRLGGLVVFFIGLSTLSHPYGAAVLGAIFAAAGIWQMLAARYKKPLVWTPRAIRIYSTALALAAALTVALVFICDHSSAFRVLFTVAMTLLGCYCGSHLIIAAAGIILQPLENATTYRNYAIKRRDSKYITAALKEAHPMVEIDQRQLDADEFLLNTPSATYDLRIGLPSAHEHTPADFITKQTTVDPSDEGMDIWQDALETFFCGDNELIDYVQEIAGLSAIGKVCVEGLIIAYGEGRNGKSTFWNTLSRVLGTYSGNMSADTLTVGCKRNVKPELAEAKGKRIIIAAELEEGMRLNTSNVKQLCSTDEIYAEKKYKDPFSFVPSHTLVLYTNHLPKVGAIDAGTWRRLIVIPFNAKIEGSSDIKNYADYLFNKAGGAILKWIMTGAKRVIEKDYHIVKPAVVEAAIQKYKDNNDWLSQFLDECCEIDSSYSAKSGDVYNAYRSYCMQVGDYIRSTTDFYTALECAGFERKRSKSARLLFGLQLKSDFLD